ncbi:MAG: hypothetical protein WDN69_16680 [Aliidongia sp.]
MRSSLISKDPPCHRHGGPSLRRRLLGAGLLLAALAGCAGITPRPDLIKGTWQTPQSVYDGGG